MYCESNFEIETTLETEEPAFILEFDRFTWQQQNKELR